VTHSLWSVISCRNPPTHPRGPHAGNHESTRLHFHEILRGSPDNCVMSVSCLVLRQLLGVLYLCSAKECLSQWWYSFVERSLSLRKEKWIFSPFYFRKKDCFCYTHISVRIYWKFLLG
jgi:hypothetical protein